MPHKPVFFEGSVEEAITACSQAQNLLLVFLHGTDPESVAADIAIHRALQSQPRCLGLRLFDDIRDEYQSNFTDAKHFRELVPTITVLPAACILSPDGVILAEMEGLEVSEQVEQEMWKAQSSLSLPQIMGSSTDGPASLDSSRSSSFQQTSPNWRSSSPMSSKSGNFGLHRPQPEHGVGDSSFINQQRREGLQLDLITSFPRSEAIGVAEALAKASSQAAHAAAGHTWNRAQMPKQLATIHSMPSTPKMPAMPKMPVSQSLGSGFSQNLSSFPSQAPPAPSMSSHSHSHSSSSQFPRTSEPAPFQSLAASAQDPTQAQAQTQAAPSREQLLAHATQSLRIQPKEGNITNAAVSGGNSEHLSQPEHGKHDFSSQNLNGQTTEAERQNLASGLQSDSLPTKSLPPESSSPPNRPATESYSGSEFGSAAGQPSTANQEAQSRQPENDQLQEDELRSGAASAQIPADTQPHTLTQGHVSHGSDASIANPSAKDTEETYRHSPGDGTHEETYHDSPGDGTHEGSKGLKPFDKSILNPVYEENTATAPDQTTSVAKPIMMYEDDEVENLDPNVQETESEGQGLSQGGNGKPSPFQHSTIQAQTPDELEDSESEVQANQPPTVKGNKANEVEDAGSNEIAKQHLADPLGGEGLQHGSEKGDRADDVPAVKMPDVDQSVKAGQSSGGTEVGDHKPVMRPTAVVNKYLELRAKKGQSEHEIQPVIKDFPSSQGSHMGCPAEKSSERSREGQPLEQPQGSPQAQGRIQEQEPSIHENKPAAKPKIEYEDHESAASEIQSLLKPQIWYEEEELNPSPAEDQQRQTPTESLRPVVAHPRSGGSQPNYSTADFLLSMSRGQDSQRAPFRTRSGPDYNAVQSPSYRSQSPSYRSQSPSYRSQSPSYKSQSPSYRAQSPSNRQKDSAFNRLLDDSNRPTGSAEDSRASFTEAGGKESKNGPSEARSAGLLKAPATPEKSLPQLRLSVPSPESSKWGSQPNPQIYQQSEVALPLTFRDMPDSEIADLYRSQAEQRKSHDPSASTEMRPKSGSLSVEEQQLADVLTAPEGDVGVAAFRERYSEQAAFDADGKPRGRDRSRSPRSSRKSTSRQSTQRTDEHGSEVTAIQPRRQSAQFRGFDIASHKHTSPITSPRTVHGDLDSNSRFEFFKPGDSSHEEESSSSEGEKFSKTKEGEAHGDSYNNQPRAGQQSVSESSHAEDFGSNAPSEALGRANTSTSESEISLSENLPDSKASSPRSGPTQAEMESTETKTKLKQADIIPLPDRPHHDPTPQQAAVGRAGMANVAVGSMTVYLGSLLVMMLGFLSGLFSASATKLAVVAPEAVKEAIAQPFFPVREQNQGPQQTNRTAPVKSHGGEEDRLNH